MGENPASDGSHGVVNTKHFVYANHENDNENENHEHGHGHHEDHEETNHETVGLEAAPMGFY